MIIIIMIIMIISLIMIIIIMIIMITIMIMMIMIMEIIMIMIMIIIKGLRSRDTELAACLAETQRLFGALGAPHFGAAYTAEALLELGIAVARAEDGWLREARLQCQSVVGDWQIPSSHSIVAYAQWDVWCQGGAEEGRLVEPGRVFRSGWSENVADDVKELLHPFTQIIKRDMHSERVALLELLDAVLQRAAAQPEPGAGRDAVLAACEGSLQVYLSHFPSLSSVAVFCQFLRRCPRVRLTFGFDDAWLSCCGQPRST